MPVSCSCLSNQAQFLLQLQPLVGVFKGLEGIAFASDKFCKLHESLMCARSCHGEYVFGRSAKIKAYVKKKLLEG